MKELFSYSYHAREAIHILANHPCVIFLTDRTQ